MGQQQLLLLAISLIVAAIAVLAGIEAVQQGIRQSAADRLVDRGLTVASAAVAWKIRKDPFVGGNASYAGLATNGNAKIGLSDTTEAGVVVITAATDGTLEVTGVSLRYPELGIRTYVEEYEVLRTDVKFDGSITIDD